jgi:hypothetical protein
MLFGDLTTVSFGFSRAWEPEVYLDRRIELPLVRPVGRDKEPSTFHSRMFTVGATWQLPPLRWGGLERSTVNLFYDYALYDYADFRDILKGGAPGEEPLYNFDADVIRLFISAWF